MPQCLSDAKVPVRPPTLTRRQVALSRIMGTGLTIWANIVLSRAAPDSHPFSFALAASWIVMVVAALLCLPFLVRRREDPGRLADWEQDGAIYRFIGIGTYRWILLRSPFVWHFPEYKLSGGRSDLRRILRRAYGGEVPHAIAALLNLVMAGYFFGIDCPVAGFWALIINLPLNVYLVILQRWNRGRILQLLRRIENRPITIACTGVRESGGGRGGRGASAPQRMD